MKKQLIKEAFRLQQLAGLAPINEVFSEAMDTKFKEGDIVFVKVNGKLEDKPRQIFGAYGSDYSVSGHEKKPDGSYSTDGGISVDADDIQLAGDLKEEESAASNVKYNFTKLYKGLSEFIEMKESGEITEEEYEPILQAVLKVYNRFKEEADAGGDINEELDIDDIELDSDFENPNTSKMGTQRPTLSVAYLKLKDGTVLSGEELAKLNQDQDFLHDIANSMKDPSDLGENDMFKKKSIDTKNICNIEFDGVDHRDAPDYSDAYIYSADWCDTGEPLTEDELDQLNDDLDFVHDALYDYLY